MDKHDIGWAVHALRERKHICRTGWNGKGMWLMLITRWGVDHDLPATEVIGMNQGDSRNPMLPFIVMKTVQGQLVPWLASQTDILAEDYELAA